MEGCEAGMEKHLCERIANSPQQFVYVEIGVATGATLASLTAIAKRVAKQPWRMVGIDIVNGWSLNQSCVAQAMANMGVPYRAEVPANTASVPLVNGVSLYLKPSAAFLSENWAAFNLPINMALVDGCHGSKCVMADFNAVAPHCVPGSIVVFHDAAEAEQIGPNQPHCAEPIRVYTGIKNLGLFDHHPEWDFVEWLHGDKSRNGNSCAIFRKK